MADEGKTIHDLADIAGDDWLRCELVEGRPHGS
jgi:hypothetical protein